MARRQCMAAQLEVICLSAGKLLKGKDVQQQIDKALSRRFCVIAVNARDAAVLLVGRGVAAADTARKFAELCRCIKTATRRSECSAVYY